MDPRQILAMVNDFASWKGDAYRLATLVAAAAAEAQREKDATIAEAVSPEAAQAIRDAG